MMKIHNDDEDLERCICGSLVLRVKRTSLIDTTRHFFMRQCMQTGKWVTKEGPAFNSFWSHL